MKHIRSLALPLAITVANGVAPAQARAAAGSPRLDCGYRSPAQWLHDVRQAVARGEIADPAQRRLPALTASSST